MNESEQNALRVMLDKEEIHETLLRYCRGADRCDEALMMATFHPDGTDHHGEFSGLAHHFIADYLQRIRKAATFQVHRLSNVLIEVDGDQASSESYFEARLGRVVDGIDVHDSIGGRYVDRWERRNVAWRISRRIVVHDWSRSDPKGTTPFPRDVGAFAQGRRGPDDPVYDTEFRGSGGAGDG